MNRRAVVAALLGCSAAFVWACGLIVDHNVVQCRTNEDCDAKGGAFKRAICTDFVCRGALTCADGKPIPLETNNIAVNQRVKFVDLNQKPLPGVKVLVCPSPDNTCPDAPLRRYTTDEAGAIYAEVPSGFTGTFEVHETPPGYPPDFIKTIVYTRRFLTTSDSEDGDQAQATRLVSRFGVDFALQRASAPPTDPAKGLLFGAVFDCNGQPLAGAKVEMRGAPDGLEPGVTRFYSGTDSFPTPNAVETSPAGIFGLTNIELPTTGVRTIALRVVVRDAFDKEMQWASFEVPVQRDRLTTVGVRYSP